MAAPGCCRLLSWRFTQGNLQVLSICKPAPVIFLQQQRGFPTDKHYDPRFKKHRGKKFIKVDLPNFNEDDKTSAKQQREEEKRKKQMGPVRATQDTVVNMSCSRDLFDKYKPDEADGVASSIFSTDKARLKMNRMKMMGYSYRHLRTVSRYEEDFSTSTFPRQAEEIYIEANTLLQDIKKNEDRLHDLITEHCYPDMTSFLYNKTLCWKYVSTIEQPKVVQVRTNSMMFKDNLYAQVTVRFHSKQTLAIYDRFGHLMFGSEDIVKNVLEYVVFEKHIVDYYGKWKIHGKISHSMTKDKVQESFHKTLKKPEALGKN